MLFFLDWFGTAVFAVSGALAAGRKNLDIFGAVVIAFVTAVGGGTVRDLLLGLTPVFWIRQPNYVAVPVIAALLTLYAMRHVRLPRRTLLVCDAVGLGVFTALGCERTLQVNQAFVIVVMMGAVSGVAGGALRDVLCGDIPTILRAEIYATAALAGGAVFYALWKAGLDSSTALGCGALFTIMLRLAALRLKAELPAARLESPRD